MVDVWGVGVGFYRADHMGNQKSMITSFLTNDERKMTWRCVICCRFPLWHYWPATKLWSLRCADGYGISYCLKKEDAIIKWNATMEHAFTCYGDYDGRPAKVYN